MIEKELPVKKATHSLSLSLILITYSFNDGYVKEEDKGEAREGEFHPLIPFDQRNNRGIRLKHCSNQRSIREMRKCVTTRVLKSESSKKDLEDQSITEGKVKKLGWSLRLSCMIIKSNGYYKIERIPSDEHSSPLSIIRLKSLGYRSKKKASDEKHYRW